MSGRHRDRPPHRPSGTSRHIRPQRPGRRRQAWFSGVTSWRSSGHGRQREDHDGEKPFLHSAIRCFNHRDDRNGGAREDLFRELAARPADRTGQGVRCHCIAAGAPRRPSNWRRSARSAAVGSCGRGNIRGRRRRRRRGHRRQRSGQDHVAADDPRADTSRPRDVSRSSAGPRVPPTIRSATSRRTMPRVPGRRSGPATRSCSD